MFSSIFHFMRFAWLAMNCDRKAPPRPFSSASEHLRTLTLHARATFRWLCRGGACPQRIDPRGIFESKKKPSVPKKLRAPFCTISPRFAAVSSLWEAKKRGGMGNKRPKHETQYSSRIGHLERRVKGNLCSYPSEFSGFCGIWKKVILGWLLSPTSFCEANDHNAYAV